MSASSSGSFEAGSRLGAETEQKEGNGGSSSIRRLIWLYFWLLMTEGILRKWVLPGLSNPLLLVRDPVALLIYALAFSQGRFVVNSVVLGLFGIGVLSILTGVSVGTGDPFVTLYGFDANFLHLPLIFIIPEAFDRDDVVKLGRWVLILAIPMAMVMAMQFNAPSGAWINCGAGGGLEAQIRGALGKIRPPGFFTFITGAAQFLALATVFLVYGLLQKGTYNRLFLILCGIAVALSAGISTSRLTLGSMGLVLGMIAICAIYNRATVTGVLRMLMPIGIILMVVNSLDVFGEGRQVFEARFEEAGDGDVGVGGKAANWSARVFGDLLSAFDAAEGAPLLGRGLGLGTNVGARLLTGGMGFLAAESEWARVIIELGPPLGFIYLFLRVLTIAILYTRCAASAREGNALPMLLFGACGLLILNGQFGQTTTVGFAVLGGGLCLAASNVSSRGESSSNEMVACEGAPGKFLRPGRSRYAEWLHG